MSDDPSGSTEVTISNEQEMGVDEPRLESLAVRTTRLEGAAGQISIVLTTPARMAELNARFMGEEGPTDVLAFPIDGLVTEPQGSPVVIGEIVICPAVADQAGSDLNSELDLLVVHGVLHLLGHDHEDEAGAAAMRDRERAITGRSGTS
jgi:probable rRNA maturation factor